MNQLTDLLNVDLEVYDTLRDGCQDPELSLNFEQKLQMAKETAKMSKDIPVEFSYAASDPDPKRIYRTLSDTGANIATFGSTFDPKKTIHTDPNMQKIMFAVDGGAKTVTIYGKTRGIDIEDLESNKEEYLNVIETTVRHLKEYGVKRVIYDAEHFFSGYEDDPEYAKKTLLAAVKGGADTVVLCNTKGGLLPMDVKDKIDGLGEFIEYDLEGIRLGFHGHNDTDSAVGNTDTFILTAAKYTDLLQVQGTFNGYGERTGNANLTSIIPNTVVKRGVGLDFTLEDLTKFANIISSITGVPLSDKAPWVGRFAFSDKAGIHKYCEENFGCRYRHEDPALVGNVTRDIITSMTGRDHYKRLAEKFGYSVHKDSENITKMYEKIVQMEKHGYKIHASPAEHLLLVHDIFSDENLKIHLTEWETKVKYNTDELEYERKSTTKIEGYFDFKSEGLLSRLEQEVSSYMGPVDSQFSALQEKLSENYDFIKDINLIDFKVGITRRETQGSKSAVITYITFQDNGNTWTTQGVSNNILESTLEAIKKGFRYYILANKVYKNKNEDEWA